MENKVRIFAARSSPWKNPNLCLVLQRDIHIISALPKLFCEDTKQGDRSCAKPLEKSEFMPSFAKGYSYYQCFAKIVL
jgi:hypothetical protein